MANLASTVKNENWLRQKYEVEEKTVEEVAALAGCSIGWVSSWLHRFAIRTRSGPAVRVPRRTCLCCGNSFQPRCEKSTQRFCSRSCAKRLKYRDTLHSRDWVHAQYVDNGLSTREIAKLVGCTDYPVGLALSRFGITARSCSEGKKLVFDRRGRKHVAHGEMVAAYGGKCDCCGETEHAFLTLDHIGGGGAEHRKKFRDLGQNHVQMIRQELKAAGWPKDGYRCLCMNCNFATRGGRTCPHELKRQAAMRCVDPNQTTQES